MLIILMISKVQFLLSQQRVELERVTKSLEVRLRRKLARNLLIRDKKAKSSVIAFLSKRVRT